MKKIILPLDFSACSENALHNGIKIAERLDMELCILHAVVAPVGFAEGASIYSLDDEMVNLEKSAKEQMESLLKRHDTLEKITYSLHIEHGPLLENIQQLLANDDVAFIVMGTTGASGLEKIILGTNAYSILKHVNVPVIALPENADITQMKHIGLAGDYKKVPKTEVIQPLLDLARGFFAKVHIIHVDDRKILVSEQVDVAKRMEKYLRHTDHAYHYTHSEDVEAALVRVAQQENVDLLTMISHQHSFLDQITHGSHTRRMMMHIPMALMILKE